MEAGQQELVRYRFESLPSKESTEETYMRKKLQYIFRNKKSYHKLVHITWSQSIIYVNKKAIINTRDTHRLKAFSMHDKKKKKIKLS